ncbi:hypothetical protein QA599_10195 [Haloarculaceae archaeon H-GB1-1]|nr:hypothetical protein [Haloarculaceae archaeon H-GB1-1]
MRKGRSEGLQRSVEETFGRSKEPSLAVVDALASLEGDAPHETEFVLSDYVDPEALDALFSAAESNRRVVSVEFTVREYAVVVRGDGTVTVSRLGTDV